MAGSKANRHATKTDTLIRTVNDARQARGLDRHRIIPRVSQLPSGGGNNPAGGQHVGASGNFLDPTGDTMVGPIAFSPQPSFLDKSDPLNPTMDIGINSGDYTSYIFLTGDNDDLRTILNASFSGQLLYLQYTGLGVLTIKQGDGTDGGNIVTNTGGDLIVNFGEVVIMLFDVGGGADPGVNGAWRVVAGGGSGAGGITQLGDLSDVDFPTALVDNQVLTFNGSTLLWENKAFPTGGMNTDLSNMTDPTVPTVNLSMNGQSIQGVLNVDFDGFGGILGLSNLQWRQLGQNITSLSDGVLYNVDNLQAHIFDVGGVTGIRVAGIGGGVVALELLNNSIDDVKDINFDGNAIINNLVAGIGLNTSGATPFMEYNVGQTDESHVFSISANTRFSISLGGTNVVGTSTTDILQLRIGGSVSTIAGRMRSDGTDTFIFSGGEERNITNVVAGDLSKISQLNSSVEVIDSGAGSIIETIDGFAVSIKDANTFNIQQAVSFGANILSGLGNTTPGGTSNFELGGDTLFWTKVFSNELILGDVNNVIKADGTFGINYEVSTSRNHDFLVAGATRFRVTGSLATVNGINLDMTNNDIINVDDIDMVGTGSVLAMNGGDIFVDGGDITDVDTITFNGSGSRITNIDDILFRSASGSSLDLNGGDILGVDDLTVTDRITHGSGGSGNLGFFGQSPTIRRVVLNPSGTSNNALFTALNDLINALGTLNGFGIGLVDTQN